MRLVALLLVALALLSAAPAGAAPEGQLTWAVHTTLVPTYFDPAETIILTPFMVLYGLHDALVKPMPGKSMAPSQQLVHERAMFAPIYELAFISGIGRRVEESGLGLIAGYAFSAPFEDVTLKAK